MSSSKSGDPKHRLSVLRRLLSAGELSTQEELAQELRNQDLEVTQSTISRDLRRLGAVKAVDASGRTVYRLPEDFQQSLAPLVSGGLRDLLLDIRHNGSLIVIHTPPGSASLIAHHLDQTKPEGILGTIAGDDTIFIAPVSVRQIEQTLNNILEGMPS